MNKTEIADLVEFTEGAAHREMFGAAPLALGFEVQSSDNYVARFSPSFDIMMFNRVVGLGVRKPASEEMIAGIVDDYRQRGIKNFAIQISPYSSPSALHDWVSSHGLAVRDYWAKLYRPATTKVDPIPTDLRIESIGKDRAAEFAVTTLKGFGMPPELEPLVRSPVGLPGWKHYIAWDGETPAAVAAVMIKPPVAWLGIATTLPEYRRRGAQGALMNRRILDAAEHGCEWVVTETGKDLPDKPNPSFRNMLRTGFVVAYDRPNYMLPPSQ